MKTNANKENDEVYVAFKNYVCEECGSKIRKEDLYAGDSDEPVCIGCAGLKHLERLPSGNSTMTRRVRKHSGTVIEIYNRSHSVGRSRKRPMGLLVDKGAIKAAEDECAQDEEKRKAQRERARIREAKREEKYIEAFAAHIRKLFPGCPEGVERHIAEHACEKHSGRVGRCASAKELDDDAVILSVYAHVRHNYTDYDELMNDHFKEDARRIVKPRIDEVIESWKEGPDPQKAA